MKVNLSASLSFAAIAVFAPLLAQAADSAKDYPSHPIRLKIGRASCRERV